MIYDIMYRDGANYKQFFRAEISEELIAELWMENEKLYADLYMERSGLSIGEFFRFMGWSYNPDIDHNILDIQGLSESQEIEADITFSGDGQIEMVTKEETIWVCSDCGSREVEVKQWVSVNNETVKWDLTIVGDGDVYCPQCESTDHELVDINEYKTNNNE